MSDRKNILVVGAGFSGAVIAHRMAVADHHVTIIDKRPHLGGNAYDFVNEHGIVQHKFGPHLFHTKNEQVWNFLSLFTEWTPYQHRVKALLEDGRYVTLPANHETRVILGDDRILDVLFRPYTKKMWGMTLEEIDPSIIARVPMRDDMNDLYFPDDPFQAMPKYGYTQIFSRLLDHRNIEIILSCGFEQAYGSPGQFDHVFNSAPIDAYYDFQFGELPYRSIKFHTAHLPFKRLLPASVVNFTNDGPFTRITEWKNIPGHGTNPQWTTLTWEEPCDYKDNGHERFYPVKDADGRNRQTYLKYLELSKKLDQRMTFIGRTGLYAYLNMDQAISSALAVSNKFLDT